MNEFKEFFHLKNSVIWSSLVVHRFELEIFSWSIWLHANRVVFTVTKIYRLVTEFIMIIVSSFWVGIFTHGSAINRHENELKRSFFYESDNKWMVTSISYSLKSSWMCEWNSAKFNETNCLHDMNQHDLSIHSVLLFLPCLNVWQCAVSRSSSPTQTCCSALTNASQSMRNQQNNQTTFNFASFARHQKAISTVFGKKGYTKCRDINRSAATHFGQNAYGMTEITVKNICIFDDFRFISVYRRFLLCKKWFILIELCFEFY